MKSVIQRVSQASVTIDNVVVGEIQKGFMILLGITHTDTEKDVKWMVDKITGLRVFEDENGKMNLSLEDVGGELLIVSQFTLYGDARKGRRPSFIDAARPEKAIPLYEKFVEMAREKGVKVATGEFGADMKVSLINDGPVTLIVDSPEK
ncbi:D-aminoacyl-tRNA deacylase [Propionigenium maris DSM 9537]|uniref:D-aminoacyl-tRNA deacylase n=1 Tax=Propionigenium maris DSM 9537 TaxID=1123000 RepID=A0A9W6LPZ1_9FUSO|nr:D-aminoacyl-tRNA deacylase [Propionigenium maris]GLI58202.1 D-aminoacyl-tRNA deacylase [Propionigenium maris DSM 9537]